MEISILVEFQILQKINGEYAPISNTEEEYKVEQEVLDKFNKGECNY